MQKRQLEEERWHKHTGFNVEMAHISQLSEKRRVVNASRTDTMLGCRIRLHLSSTPKAASFASLNPNNQDSTNVRTKKVASVLL